MFISNASVAVAAMLAFCLTSLIATYLASDSGERLKNSWANLWCDPKLASDDPYGMPDCRERVIATAEEMIATVTSLMCLATAAWAGWELWQASRGRANFFALI